MQYNREVFRALIKKAEQAGITVWPRCSGVYIEGRYAFLYQRVAAKKGCREVLDSGKVIVPVPPEDLAAYVGGEDRARLERLVFKEDHQPLLPDVPIFC